MATGVVAKLEVCKPAAEFGIDAVDGGCAQAKEGWEGWEARPAQSRGCGCGGEWVQLRSRRPVHDLESEAAPDG